MYLNKNISFYRKHCGYTQEQLAERLGVTAQSISKWETGISNPDVAVLPDLAKALGVDIDALFVALPDEPKEISFSELPGLCYDAVLPLFLKAQRNFYGKKGVFTEENIQKKVDELKEQLGNPLPKCAYMIDECGGEHGAVFLSDALTLIDREYGGNYSALLFDVDLAGEVLSVIGKRNNRKMLKAIYQKLITEGGDGMSVTPEELSVITGLSVDAVNEAGEELRRAALIDVNESIGADGYKKVYGCVHKDELINPTSFVTVLAILRLAYIHASNMECVTLLYRDAKNGGVYIGGTV